MSLVRFCSRGGPVRPIDNLRQVWRARPIGRYIVREREGGLVRSSGEGKSSRPSSQTWRSPIIIRAFFATWRASRGTYVNRRTIGTEFGRGYLLLSLRLLKIAARHHPYHPGPDSGVLFSLTFPWLSIGPSSAASSSKQAREPKEISSLWLWSRPSLRTAREDSRPRAVF